MARGGPGPARAGLRPGLTEVGAAALQEGRHALAVPLGGQKARLDLRLDGQLAVEAEVQPRLLTSEGHREGVAAFLERRSPDFG